MNKKMVLKKKVKNNNRLIVIIIIIFISIFFSYRFIDYFSKMAVNAFITYGEAETKKVITLIINNAIGKEIKLVNTDNLFNVVKSENDNIQMIDFNSIEVTKLLNIITSLIQSNLNALKEGNVEYFGDSLSQYNKEKLRKGVIYEIPYGAWTNNIFLSNLGPKIPVKIYSFDDVVTNIKTDIKEYGINNALLSVGIHIEVTSVINMPFVSRKIVIETDVPVALKMIQGKIPNFYLDGLSKSSFNYK